MRYSPCNVAPAPRQRALHANTDFIWLLNAVPNVPNVRRLYSSILLTVYLVLAAILLTNLLIAIMSYKYRPEVGTPGDVLGFCVRSGLAAGGPPCNCCERTSFTVLPDASPQLSLAITNLAVRVLLCMQAVRAESVFDLAEMVDRCGV